MEIKLKDILKGATSQAVANSQTNQVVSEVHYLTAEDTMALAFEITAASVSGTGAVVKIQQSFDGTNFTDVDATNAKITITDNGRFPLALSPSNSNLSTKMPIAPYVRFVCTTGGSDAATITKILVTTTRVI